MKHPNKEINKVVQHALSNGWTLRVANGHAWGVLRCPKNKADCAADGSARYRFGAPRKIPAITLKD